METVGRPSGRDRTAIAASIALHVCALAVLVTFAPRSPFSTDDPDERTLLTTIIRLPPPPIKIRHEPTHRALVLRSEIAHPVERPVIHTLVATGHATRALAVAKEVRYAYASAEPSAPVVAHEVDPAPVPVATGAPVAKAPESSPVPTAPPATAAPVVQLASRDEGIGNFGESYPASIEPTLRRALLAVGAGFVVRVAVDEDGHATAVDFVRGPDDPVLRDALRAKLLAARFIPAACNGLRCAGTLELRT